MRIFLSHSFLPRVMLFAFPCWFSHRLIWWRADDVKALFNQLLEGYFSGDVTISTMSPVFKIVLRGDAFPLILALALWSPISVWIRKAKSRAEAPAGREMTLPFGVKT